MLTGQTWDSSVAFPGQSLSGLREEEEDQEKGENELLPRDAIARLQRRRYQQRSVTGIGYRLTELGRQWLTPGSKVWNILEHYALANLVVEASTIAPCFLASGQTSLGSCSTALRLPSHIPRENMDVSSPNAFQNWYPGSSFVLSLSLPSSLHLFSPSPLTPLYSYSLSSSVDLSDLSTTPFP